MIDKELFYYHNHMVKILSDDDDKYRKFLRIVKDYTSVLIFQEQFDMLVEAGITEVYAVMTNRGIVKAQIIKNIDCYRMSDRVCFLNFVDAVKFSQKLDPSWFPLTQYK